MAHRLAPAPQLSARLLHRLALGLAGCGAKSALSVEPPGAGWLILWRHDSSPGYSAMAVDAEGRVESVREHLGDRSLTNAWYAAPRPGGGAAFAAMTRRERGEPYVSMVAMLDREGAIEAQWEGPPADPDSGESWQAWPHLVVDGGRVFLLYHRLSEDSTPNRVELMQLGCVGP